MLVLKHRFPKMTPEDEELLAVHIKEIARILYRNTPETSIETFEGIETTVRDQVIEHVSPKIAFFFVGEKTGTTKGKTRTIKSCVGKIKITNRQALRLGIEPYTRFSPMLSKCCLLLSANVSFQDAESDIKVLMGIEVGHSTHHRQVKKVDLSPPNVKQKLTEVSLDGGKVRLRSQKRGQPTYWKEYKTGRLNEIYYGAFFQDNLALTDWVNSQKLANTLYCLGDGHDGIWNLFSAIANPESRQEILDWYHLKENLYKIQTKKQFLLQIESFLWHGQVQSAIEKLRKSKYVGVTQFTNYLHKHRHRLVNYMYFQAEQLSSIGSGAVESAVKQIDKRMQIVGAQWKYENLPQMLQLRCAYLNGQLAQSC